MNRFVAQSLLWGGVILVIVGWRVLADPKFSAGISVARTVLIVAVIVVVGGLGVSLKFLHR